MLSGEATNANFIVFGLTLSGLEPTIYRTLGEHANHYTTDAVKRRQNLCHDRYFAHIMYKWRQINSPFHNNNSYTSTITFTLCYRCDCWYFSDMTLTFMVMLVYLSTIECHHIAETRLKLAFFTNPPFNQYTRVRVMVFKATFNNISVISWQ